MNPAIHARKPGILLPFLVAACSGPHQGGQPIDPVAAVAATQPAAAPAASVSGPGPVVQATSASSAQPATPSPATAAAPQPVRPETNQANQAALAKQWNTAMEDSGAAPAAAVQPTQPDRASAATAHPGELPQAAYKPTMAAKPTLHAGHAGVPATSHVGPPFSTGVASHIATSGSPSLSAVAGSMEARRRVRFVAVASRLQSPIVMGIAKPPPQRTLMLKLGNVGISNFDDALRVHFAIQTLQSDWADEYLDPRDTREFFCNATDSPGCLFWMKTGDKPPVEYAMDQSHRYAIFWDSDKEIWDLQMVAPPADGSQ